MMKISDVVKSSVFFSVDSDGVATDWGTCSDDCPRLQPPMKQCSTVSGRVRPVWCWLVCGRLNERVSTLNLRFGSALFKNRRDACLHHLRMPSVTLF